MVKKLFHIKLKSKACLLAAALFSTLLLFGCSGGGNEAKLTPLASATITNGLLKLGTVGTTTDLIAGMDLRVNLPAGVTVDADPSGEVSTGAVTLSGVAASGGNSLVVAKYAPAGVGVPATLHIVLINTAGFHPGEFVTVRFNLAAGSSFPALNKFTIANFSAKGLDSSPLSGMTAAPLSVEAAGNMAGNKQAQLIVTGGPVTVVPVFLNISVATPTRIPSQTISGALTNVGDTLTITTDTAATVTALVITGGTWNALVSGLVEGDNIITVTEKGGGGAAVAIVKATITLDTKEPFLNIDTAIGARNGSVGIAGTAETGSRIEVECEDFNSIVIPKEIIKADHIFFDDLTDNITRWSAMILGLFHEEDILFHHEVDIKCKVKAVDAAGNENVKDVEIKFDDIPPDLDIHFDEFVKFGDIYIISGTVEAGAAPSVSVSGGATVGPITFTGNTWSAPLSGLAAGINTVTVTATDTAGNVTTKTTNITAVAATGSFSGALMPTVADALKALRMAVGLSAPTALDLLRGDCLADGKIDVGDAILILKKVVGL